jgi:hypothetical protein
MEGRLGKRDNIEKYMEGERREESNDMKFVERG